MATIAQTLRKQGLEQGKAIGEKEAARKIAKRLLLLHDVVTVSELTGLTVEEVQEIAENRPK